MTKTKNIAAAISFLDAIRISPRRWAYHASETDRWYKIDAKDLELLGRMLADTQIGRGYAYSEWCACSGVEMPESWSP